MKHHTLKNDMIQNLIFCFRARRESLKKSLFRTYTIVYEHFEGAHNAAMGQNMRFC